MLDAPYLRCSDADRDRAAGVLRDSLGEGRITVTELDDRLDRVYRAQTYGELTAVMGDLPAWLALAHGPAAPTPYPVGQPPYPAPAWQDGRPAGRTRPFFVTVAAVWLLWLVVVAAAPVLAGMAQLPLLLVVIWGFVLLARRNRRRCGSDRHLPPHR